MVGLCVARSGRGRIRFDAQSPLPLSFNVRLPETRGANDWA